MAKIVNELDLTKVAVGVTVKLTTRRGNVYRITRQADGPIENQVIGALYIDKTGPSVSDNEIEGNGELRGQRYVEVGERWMFNRYDGTAHDETPVIESITILDD